MFNRLKITAAFCFGAAIIASGVANPVWSDEKDCESFPVAGRSICVQVPGVVRSISSNPSCSVEGSEVAGATGAFCGEWLTASLCGDPMGPEGFTAWDKLAESESGDLPENQINLKKARILLLRFQKPGGFVPEKDLGPLIAILRSRDLNLVQLQPEEVQRALQGVLHFSSNLYESILTRVPGLTELSPEAHPEKACRTPAETETLKKDVEAYVKGLIADKKDRSRFSNWEKLAPLAALLGKLPEDKVETFRDLIAQGMTDQFLEENRRTISPSMESKIYLFAHHATGRFFGKSQAPITDLTYLRGGDRLTPIVLSTGKISGSDLLPTDSHAGFEFSTLAGVAVPENGRVGEVVTDKRVRWKVGDKDYEGTLKAAIADAKDGVIPHGAAPDYASMWKDGALTGLVVMGSNLNGEEVSQVYEYKTYLAREGFKFSEPKPISGVKERIQRQIESGELDYWIKEAHMHGDLETVLELKDSGMIEEASRTRPDGKKEKIDIIYPAKGDAGSSSSISSRELGAWFKAREARGLAKGGQLAIISTTCNSAQSTIRQIEAVQSRLFLPIQSLTLTTGIFGMGQADFARSPILDGLRTGRDFEWMRKGMDELVESSRKSGEKQSPSFGFAFPSEKKFKDDVVDLLKTPLNVDLSVTENGVPYNPSRVH